MALRPFQNSSSRLMLVLRPAITTDRLVTVEFMVAPFLCEAVWFQALLARCAPGANRASGPAGIALEDVTIVPKNPEFCSSYVQIPGLLRIGMLLLVVGLHRYLSG